MADATVAPIIAAISRARALMMRRDQQTMTRLVQVYGQIWVRLQEQLHTVEDAIAAGRDQAYLKTRVLALARQVEDEVARYAIYADQEVALGVQAGIGQGLGDASRAVQARLFPYGDEVIKARWHNLPTDAVETRLGMTGPSSPLYDRMTERLGASVADGVRKGLTEGIALGYNPAKIQDRLRQTLGQGLTWSLSATRTAQLWAYREATRAGYMANSDIVSSWTWHSALDGRCCLSCWAQHGTIHPMSEPLNDHFCGRCHPGDVLVFGPSPVAVSSRYYSGQIITIRTAGGVQLSLTPNHPVLTRRGWVAGGFLQEGDDVVCGSFREYAAAAIDKDDDHVPTSIKEIAESFRMILGEMPCSAENFHGDGEGSEVYVVRANGLLGNTSDASLSEPTLEYSFGGGCRPLSELPGPGYFAAMLKRMGLPSRSILSYGDTAQMLLARGFFGQQTVGFGLVSELNAGAKQSGPNSRASNAEMFGDGVLGFAGQIEGDNLCNRKINPCRMAVPGAIMDRVVSLSSCAFSGHVHSLQTKGQWYIASDSIVNNGGGVKGIITHNCAMVPITRSWAEMGFEGIPETTAEIEPGEQQFGRLGAEAQRQMMGESMYKAWQAGEFRFSDLSSRYQDDVYGEMRVEASLKGLLGEKAKEYYKQKEAAA